jgi:hypothetical protein
MPHYGIFGRTESGKSTLGRIIAKAIRQRVDRGDGGNVREVVVINPMLEKWESAHRQFDDVYTAHEYLRKTTGCVVFVEEISIAIDDADKKEVMKRWLTIYRHLSHSFYILGQRYIMLEPTLRDMISSYFVFAMSDDDAIALAKKFGHDSLRTSHLQPNLHFLYARFSATYSGKIDWEKQCFTLTPRPSRF